MSALDLNFESTGTIGTGGAGDPVIILHGLFGQGRNWSGIARGLSGLSTTHTVFTVDLRNHGASPWDDEMTYEAMAADVARLIDIHAGGAATVIGHSMGGKVAMTLALTKPGMLHRLCIVDIAPAPYSHDFESHLKAMSSLDVAGFARRSEAEAALLEQLDDPFLARFLIRNLKAYEAPSEITGGFSWSVNLSALAVHMDDILDFPAFEADQAYEGPALFLAGGDSDYIQPCHQGEIERLFPTAETEIIDGAGHWLHAEKPDVITARLARFLAA